MFSASPDATIRIWSVPNASCVQVVRAHESSVTGLSLHATGDYLLSSSDDQVRPPPSPEEACWPPGVDILGGGIVFPAPAGSPEPWRGAQPLWRGAGFARVSPLGSRPSLQAPALLLALLSLFQYWAFSDIQTGRVLTKVTDETSGCCELPRALGSLSICYLSFVFMFYLLICSVVLPKIHWLPVPAECQALCWARRGMRRTRSRLAGFGLSQGPLTTRPSPFLYSSHLCAVPP